MAIKRGRPAFKNDDIPILKYEQKFEDPDGTTYTWFFDKTFYSDGVKCVIIHDPAYNKSDKLIREIEIIEKKYESKPGIRKLRITKLDSINLEKLKKQLDDEYYRHYPDEHKAPKIRKNKTKKV